jgi:Fe-S cluster assembly protein SufD
MSAVATEPLSPVEAKLKAFICDNYLPLWFNSQRVRARDAYFDLALPDRTNEEWHYGEPKRFSLDALDIAHPRPGFNGTQYERICGLTGMPRRVSCLSMIGPNVSDLSQSDALLKAGVTVMSLRQALILRGEQIQPYWTSNLVRFDSTPMMAAHYALVDNGFFVHVPAGVKAPEPVHLIMESGEAGSVVAPHVLIALEAGAEADVYLHFIGSNNEQRSLSLGVVQSHIAAGAKLKLAKVQHLGLKTDSLSHEAAEIGADAFYGSVGVYFGGYHVRHELLANLAQANGHAELAAMYLLQGRQRYDFHTHQKHLAPATKSNLLFKGALLGRSRASYQGIITVAQQAQKTDAYQANRNLLLSSEARSDSSPQLEISANDVRCTHGSTASNVSPAEMFYLANRGLAPDMARRLLVSGFMAEVADRIPLTAVRDYAYNHVQERVE